MGIFRYIHVFLLVSLSSLGFTQSPCHQLDSIYKAFTNQPYSKHLDVDIFTLADACPTYSLDSLHNLLKLQTNGFFEERLHEKSIKFGHAAIGYLRKKPTFHDTLAIRYLNLIGANYRYLYQFDSTQVYYNQVERLFDNHPSTKGDFFYCVFLRGFAAFYFHSFQYTKANTYFSYCLDCHEKMENDDRYHSASLRVYSEFLLQAGQIDSAEEYLQRAINLNLSLAKPSNNNLKYEFYRLKTLAEKKGDFSKAINYQEEGRKLIVQMYGADFPESVLLTVKSKQSQLNQNKITFTEFQQFVDSIKKEPQYILPISEAYVVTAMYLKNKKLYAESCINLEIADSLYQIFYQGAEQKKYQVRLYLYGVYQRLGDLAKASTMLESYYASILKSHPPNHPKIGNYHHYSSQLQFLSNDFNKAITSAQKAAHINRNYIASFASFCSEYELEKVTSHYEDDMRIHRNMAWRQTERSAGFASICYDDALFMKGFVLKNNQQLRKEIAINPEAAQLQSQVLTAKSALSQASTSSHITQETLHTIEEEVSQLEKSMARSLRSGKAMGQAVTWEDLEPILTSDEAAIEFIHFSLTGAGFEPIDSVVYAAILLRHGEAPVCFPLCTEVDLAKALQAKGANIYAAKSPLYGLIWQPLLKELQGIHKVWLAPSGLLHRLSFSAIQQPSGEPLCTAYELHTVSSTRDLLERQTSFAKSSPPTALLLGGLDYEHASTTYQEAVQDIAYAAPSLDIDASLTMRGRSWNGLKWTSLEVDSITHLLQENGFSTITLKDADGTEAYCKRMGNEGHSPTILHLSTHGYFFPDPNSKEGASDETVWVRSENPLIRSGLILSGGNLAWKQKASLVPGAEDGILTALEISQMDLSHTHLVVLSACETGLGDIKGSEGVYGLQRAFQIAGAKNIVMSMWQVPDWHTKELMIRFYHYWLQEKLPISLALQQAQLSLRDEGYEPFYWAGFVVLE